ncbi:MAG: hypothetical protein LBS65_02305 [Desulfovibrio sp.]|jgi:hypothetical protein|nr:hypothetical protein [Desulfovibrio sp.]
MAETRERPEAEETPRSLVLSMVLSVAFLAALALSLVWMNIERTKLSYRLRNLQSEFEQALDMNAKLNAEREYLLSPHELGKKAEAYGLMPAKPGQVRRLEAKPPDGELKKE